MTHGIYKLSFGPLTYIGKSEDIESRSASHRSNLITGNAEPPLLEAFKQYGFPTIQILEIVRKDPTLLNNREAYWVAIECPQLNNKQPRFRTLGKTSYADDQTRLAFKLIMKKHDWVDVCEQSGFSMKMLISMVKGTDYIWLANEFPINYPRMRTYSYQLIAKNTKS